MSDTVERIKERLSIVDVVQGYVKLTRAGKYWKGSSPFTKEKTPSFFVSPDRGLYHCFSTGKGGDMFTFVEEMESVDFKGALKILADKAGIEIVREAPGVRDERADLYAALQEALLFYESTFERQTEARAYVLGRGLTEATIRSWHIGYAPKDWRPLADHLKSKGFTPEILLKAGLIKRPDTADGATSDRAPYDRFRGRIMFPLFDVSGRVIAFSGRIFEDDAAHPQAKYINSPEGPLFDKSRALYGIHEAKTGIRNLGFSMLVEGQVDLVLAHQLGYKNAVATSGTAVTASHVDILKRYSNNILLSYDGDKAGIRATHRAAELLLPAGLNVKVVALPEGVDPADQIVKDPAVFKEAVKHAQPVIDFFVSHILNTVPDARQRRLDIGTIVLPLIAKIPNALDQSHFVARIAHVLGVQESVVISEIDKVRPNVPRELATVAQKDPFFADDVREKMLYGIVRTLEDEKDARAATVEAFFVESFGAERLRVRRALGDAEDESARMVASENFFTLYTTRDEQDAVLQEFVQEVVSRGTKVRDEYDALTRELMDAEKSGDTARAAAVLAQLAAL
jgi:DNA primase